MKIRKSVRHSQQLMLMSIVVLFFSLLFTRYYIKAFVEIESDLKNILYSVDEVLLLEHQLLLDRQFSTITQSGASFVILNSVITELHKDLDTFGIEKTNVEILISHVTKLEVYFNELAQLQVEIGLSENEGIRAKFRQAAHKLQDIFFSLENLPWQITILEIRRREKDYLLRGEPEFLVIQEQDIKKLSKEITQSSYEQETQAKLLELLSAYSQLIKTL